MSYLQKIENALLVLLAVTLVSTLIIGLVSPEYFELTYAAEDGLIEYGTSLLLMTASLALFWRAYLSDGMTSFLLGLYSLLFIFAAGEEISWGQRIVGWESSEFFLEHNRQYETTIHNLVVGGEQLASTLFGSFLTVMLLLYLIVLPLTYGHIGWITTLSRRLAVPVPHKRYAVAALMTTLVIVMISAPRKWEAYEFAFAIMSLAIFLVPQNRKELGSAES
ncbi:MAG: hypothetical protein JXR13_09355 [Thalassovita sp.]